MSIMEAIQTDEPVRRPRISWTGITEDLAAGTGTKRVSIALSAHEEDGSRSLASLATFVPLCAYIFFNVSERDPCPAACHNIALSTASLVSTLMGHSLPEPAIRQDNDNEDILQWHGPCCTAAALAGALLGCAPSVAGNVAPVCALG